MSMTFSLPDFQSLPVMFGFPGHFMVFLAADFTNVDSSAIEACGVYLVNHKCVYFCIWGPDCKRAHDIISKSCITVDSMIKTRCHSDETLDHALLFFAFKAIPDESYVGTGIDKAVICIGNDAWYTHIQNRLSNWRN